MDKKDGGPAFPAQPKIIHPSHGETVLVGFEETAEKPIRDTGQIGMALQELDAVLVEAHSIFTILKVQIEPVLQPAEPPCVSPPNTKEISQQKAPMAQSICRVVSRVRELITDLNDTRDRLEL